MSLLHPEVEHLLAEIAADPNSSLLRIPRAKVLPELFRPPDPIRQSAYFLTSAERHLLAVHREEVAHWLRVGLVFARTQGKRLGKTYFTDSDVDRVSWTRSKSPLLGAEGTDASLRHYILEPDRWLKDESLALEVQAIAQKLVPSPRSAVVNGQLLIGLGQTQTALQLLRESHRALGGSTHEYLLHSSSGVALWRLARHADARDAYQEAWRLGDREPFYLAAAALNGALCGEVPPDVVHAVVSAPDPAAVRLLWSCVRQFEPAGLPDRLREARSSRDKGVREVMEVLDASNI